jgi:catechol 2,3-dioxygenase-like lactoylglutathione lyase family enzyme
VKLISIDHVQVAAPPGCEAQARRFYGEILGLQEIEKPELLQAGGGVWFQLGSQQLHIGVSERFSPAEKAHPGFLVASSAIDELAAALTDAGAPVLWDERIPDRRRFYTQDPWGNRVELVEAPQSAKR